MAQSVLHGGEYKDEWGGWLACWDYTSSCPQMTQTAPDEDRMESTRTEKGRPRWNPLSNLRSSADRIFLSFNNISHLLMRRMYMFRYATGPWSPWSKTGPG